MFPWSYCSNSIRQAERRRQRVGCQGTETYRQRLSYWFTGTMKLIHVHILTYKLQIQIFLTLALCDGTAPHTNPITLYCFALSGSAPSSELPGTAWHNISKLTLKSIYSKRTRHTRGKHDRHPSSALSNHLLPAPRTVSLWSRDGSLDCGGLVFEENLGSQNNPILFHCWTR